MRAKNEESALLRVEVLRRFDDGEVIIKIPGWKELVQVRAESLRPFRMCAVQMTERDMYEMFCAVADNLPPLEECTEDAILDEIDRWIENSDVE